MSLGQLIEELLRAPAASGYRPAPYPLTLAQWRNVAAHNGYHLDKAIVSCRYRLGAAWHEVPLSVDQVLTLGQFVNDVFYAHKIAVELFAIDNAPEMIASLKANAGPGGAASWLADRGLSRLTTDGALAAGLAAAGFDVMSAERKVESGGDKTSWALVLETRQSLNEDACRLALKQSLKAYLLLTGPTYVFAIVSSGGRLFKFMFEASVAASGAEFPTNRTDVWQLDSHLRMSPRSTHKPEG